MIYLLDTTAVSDILRPNPNVIRLLDERLVNDNQVAICLPIYYEAMRGLLRKNAPKQIAILQQSIIPKLDWVPLYDEDWLQAARFWAQLVKSGRALSDMDILLASIAYQIGRAHV